MVLSRVSRFEVVRNGGEGKEKRSREASDDELISCR